MMHMFDKLFQLWRYPLKMNENKKLVWTEFYQVRIYSLQRQKFQCLLSNWGCRTQTHENVHVILSDNLMLLAIAFSYTVQILYTWTSPSLNLLFLSYLMFLHLICSILNKNSLYKPMWYMISG